MSDILNSLERGFIDAVAPAYLARAKAPCPERVGSWRYQSFMPLLHRLHGTLTGLRSRHCLIEGRRLVWLQGGNPAGEPVLLLHGFGASKENWLPLLPFLARRYQLFIPDLPGWGESQFCAETLYGLDHQVARLAEWAQQRQLPPLHVVGSSMGGGIAGLFAARHPERVRSVTLMNAAGVAGNTTTRFERGLQQGRNGLIAHNLKGVLDLLTSVMENRALALLMAPAMYWEMVSRRHVNEHMFRHLLQHEPAPELPTFAAISVPAFILWGEQDQVLHVSCGDTFKTLIPHAQFKRLRGVGHLPMVERPRVTARLLRRFWRESRGAGRLDIAAASDVL
ncbi:MAG: putative Hydrolase or acyltransferase (alpha/beta hydrolase superfamily) protein [Moraxellaceae bacterium]|jgi:pimeloyl-ACP methyl ester carboxylesterase|nr:putative Hydrolase or acyltransferase (alpha/beta hydrolase superfamily) protein [Moraxellaceae bacterium]